MKTIAFIAALLLMVVSSLLPLSEQSFGQEQSAQKIIFHVTAVHSGEAPDYCTSGDCTATRLTVEGYSDVKGDSHLTEYVLECVQILPTKPSPDFVSGKCVRLHANNDYEASLGTSAWIDSMTFAKSVNDNDEGVLHYVSVSYTIV